jgi:hypothetical protein
MPGLTSPQNFPYPLYTDPAGAGAAQIQAFAEAVDDAIVAQQTAIANATDRKRASASGTALQSIPNNTVTNATYTVEDFDNDNMVNLGVDNAAVTVVTAGFYLVQASVRFALNTVGSRQVAITIAGANQGTNRSATSIGISQAQVDTTMLVFATAGQILRISILQTSGGALNTDFRRLAATRLSG